MTEEELRTRISVGKKPVLAHFGECRQLAGWYQAVEILNSRDVEIRFQASMNEEGGVSFFGTYETTDALIAALKAQYGPVDTWTVVDDPKWSQSVTPALVEAMRDALRHEKLELPHGVEPHCDDDFWTED